MKYDFKEYEMQDLMCKGPMRRRYDNLEERYKGYLIYSYIRGEYQRFSVEDEKEKVFVETDNIEEAKQFVDDELTKA
ncbi:unknown [Clostridium sp. CAG:793]|nr:unknown [Clostridium sp. CAG:793]